MPEEFPENVRKVPAPAIRWQVVTAAGVSFDGYVFEDDPSDIAKFLRWLADAPASYPQHRLTVQKAL